MMSLVDYLESQAAVNPDRCISSFLDGDGRERCRYTYRNFAEQTRRVATHLSTIAGLKHGDRALLAYPPGLDIVVTLLACSRIGVIPVPVAPPSAANLGTALAKLTFIARDCHASALLTTRTVAEAYGSSRSGHEGAPHGESPPCCRISSG